MEKIKINVNKQFQESDDFYVKEKEKKSILNKSDKNIKDNNNKQDNNINLSSLSTFDFRFFDDNVLNNTEVNVNIFIEERYSNISLLESFKNLNFKVKNCLEVI